MQTFALKFKTKFNYKMIQQSLNKPAVRANIAPVAAALVSTVFLFSPSRRRLFIPRV
jgi:hypothetical protein